MLNQPPGNVTPGDDEIALGQILDVHHAPHQCQTVGGQRKKRTDHDAIQNDLEVYDRELE